MATTKRSGGRRSRKQSLDTNELLVLELQEIHSAESQLTRVLPRLAKAVESETLRKILDERLQQGERLLQEVESALDELESSPGRKKNVAAEGLINDAREHVQEIETGAALDAVLIAAIQKTEHYCIAAWGTAKALARVAGVKTAVKSMERALKEGSALDELLTQLAEQEVVPAMLANAEDEDQEERDEAEGDGAQRTRQKNGSSQRPSA